MTCSISSVHCLSCLGDRGTGTGAVSIPICSCQTGKYDDFVSINC